MAALEKAPRDQRALEELARINQQRQEREFKRYLDAQVQEFRAQRQKQKLRQALEQRKLELGVGAKQRRLDTESAELKRWRSEDGRKRGTLPAAEEAATDRADVLIIAEGERLPSAQLKPRRSVPPVQLLDINREEEERDKVQINLWLAKYARLFKTLFSRYVNSARPVVERTFDEKSRKRMNLSETLRFAKDHGIYPALLTKDEVA